MKRSMAGEIVAASKCDCASLDRNAYMGTGRGGISPFNHVIDYDGWGGDGKEGDTMGKYVKKQSTEGSGSWLTKLAIWWLIPWPVRKLAKIMGVSKTKNERTIKRK